MDYGKKAMYVMPDMNAQFLEIDAFEHMESEYGVFVSDSGRDQDKLEQAKSLSQAMIQNGVPSPLQFLTCLTLRTTQALRTRLLEQRMHRKSWSKLSSKLNKKHR